MNLDPELMKLVAQEAIKGVDELSTERRAQLYRGLAQIMQGPEAKKAEFTAYTLEQALEAQMQFSFALSAANLEEAA